MEYIKQNLISVIIFLLLIAYILYQRIPIYLNNQKLEKLQLPENLVFYTLDEKKYSLNDLQDKTIVLNFWATWCLPCKIEIPILESLYQELKENGLIILGINSEDKELIINFLKDQQISYPIVLDKNYQLSNLFNIQAYPSIVIIKNNKIMDASTGLNPILKWKIRWYTKKSIF